MNDSLQGSIKDARELGRTKMLLLGVQHLFAMFGATILVPILVNGFFQDATGQPITRGLTVATTLFCAGFGTLFFHVCTRFKVPAFLGSSFAFLGGFATIANLTTGIYAGMDSNTKVAYACGGIVIAGLLYLVLAGLIAVAGVKRVMHYLPPIVTGPIIICIGLSLMGSARDNAVTNLPLAIIAIVTIIIFSVWGKGMFGKVSILMGISISYCAALVLHFLGFTNADGSAILNFTSVAEAGILGIPEFQFCKFDFSAILVMAPIAIAAMMEHVGDISAISATIDENLIEDPGLHRTLIGDGLATSLSGFLGGPANTTYGENTSVLELSHVHDPRVIRLAAIFSVAISFIPKVSTIISTMPAAIIGGVSFILYGMISSIGVRNISENDVDLLAPRNLIIMSVIFGCALGLKDGLTFSIGGTTITITALALAAIVGITLNAVLKGNDYEFGSNASGDANRGIHI